jgi:DNA-binding GntR family transcriptional regulator
MVDRCVSPTPRTRADEVYGKLRVDVLAGRRKPGSRLPFAELCEHYQASASVVREGLSRLAEEGLVVATPQRGFRVAPLTADDLRNLTEVRLLTETLALRSAIAEGDSAWESRIVDAHGRLERTPQPAPDDPDRMDEAWVEAHNAFHAALLGGCRNERLLSIALSVRDASGLYQRWTRSVGQDTDRDAPAEHREMLDAALARDADRAAAVLGAHIDRTAAVLLAALERRPAEAGRTGRPRCSGAP